MLTAEFIAGKSGHGNPSAQPIFIVGMPRSGSTMLEQILAGHPRIQSRGEIEDFQEAFIALKGKKYADNAATMTAEEIEETGGRLSGAVDGLDAAGDRFTDKMLDNIYYAGLIHLALPNARIIYTRRNPVDCCLSSFSQNFPTATITLTISANSVDITATKNWGNIGFMFSLPAS